VSFTLAASHFGAGQKQAQAHRALSKLICAEKGPLESLTDPYINTESRQEEEKESMISESETHHLLLLKAFLEGFQVFKEKGFFGAKEKFHCKTEHDNLVAQKECE